MATPNLDEMSLEQLTEILNSQVSELTKIDAEIKYLQQMENQMAEQPTQTPAAMEAAAPAPMEAAAPAMPPQPAPPAMDEFGMGLTPEMIQQATAKLVEAGMFEMTTSEMSNELIGDLQVIADLLFPGLYVLSQPDQLMEFLNGIINGTIELRIPAGAAGAAGATGASPVGAAGAVPAGAGAAGAGAIPAGAGAAPAPIL
tara:strand:+ start:19053 stop:19652 length:600 start_codon:yes stop_codon:yes gene_type:complete